MEISLMVSQCICELSKLYEKQIVLEKKKASQDLKELQKQQREMSERLESVKAENQELKGNCDKVDDGRIGELEAEVAKMEAEKAS